MENNNNSSFVSPEAELLLTIRFSASIPDVLLEIPSPSTTTAAGLKQLIRARLPPELSNHRLRLIYSGRGLEDTVPLSKSLKLLPPPPRSGDGNYLPNGSNIHDEKDRDKDKGKGKAPVRDPPLPRLYVHCSIGDIVLSASDLAAEAAQASTLLIQQQQQQQQQQQGTSSLSLSQKRAQEEAQRRQQQQRQEASTTTPAPRGFDRLLSAGFTPAEVAQLRSQFLALQSVSRTPDTMPSGAELRELEDRWMDEGSTAAAMPGAGGGAGGGGGGIGGAFADDDGGFGTGSQGALDDMLWGAVMGFFWPVGCAMWLRREEGVWSWRKGLAVFVGVVINAAFGAMRVMN